MLRKPSGSGQLDSVLTANLQGVGYSVLAPPLPATGPFAGRVDFATADVPVVVQHDLDAAPDAFTWNSWASNGTNTPEQLYATLADRRQWSKTQIVLRSSVEGTVTLRVWKHGNDERR